MRKLNLLLLFSLLLLAFNVFGQKVTIEGYVFEDGNRGYLNVAEITVLDKVTKTPVTKALTNRNGVFLAEVDPGKEYLVQVTKKVFEEQELTVSTVGKSAGESVYLKVRMNRKPGYRFEVTMAEPRQEDEPVNAIQGATIEVYNNTTEKPVLDLKNHPAHHLKIGGHTDSIGSAVENQKLSEKRAKSCFDFFVKKGISKDRIAYKGFGEKEPIATNMYKDGRQQNRRVEFDIFLPE